VEVTGIGRRRPGAAKDFRIRSLQPQRRPTAGGVTLQEPSAGARIHAVVGFQVWDQFSGERRAPGTIVFAVSKFVGPGEAALIEQHPYHLRHFSALHSLIEQRRVAAAQGSQRVAKTVSEINRRIVLPGM
jgi:hypothetical protein